MPRLYDVAEKAYVYIVQNEKHDLIISYLAVYTGWT